MQTFNLDLSQKSVIPLLYAKQRDVGLKICVVLTDNQNAYNIPENTQFSVWFSGKSGSGNYTEIDGNSAFVIEGNTITVELIYQMLNNPGEHLMCLVMNGADGKQQGLWNIPYFVEAIPGANSEAATAYYNAFLDAQKKAEEAADRAAAAAGELEDVKPKDVIVTAEFEAAIPDPTGATGAMVSNGASSMTALEIATAIRGGATVKLIDNDNIVYEYDGYRLEPSNTMARFKAKVPSEEGIKIYRVNIDNELYAGRVETLIAYGGGSAEDAVTYTPQSRSTEQQTQARNNIGAFAAKEINNYFENIKSTNLLKPDELEIGAYMPPDGRYLTSASHALTGYIPVTEGDTLSYQQTKLWGDFARVISGLTFVTAFDKDKNVMSGSGQDGGNGYTVPSGVAFVRVSFGYSASYEDRAICNATEVIPYEEYYEVKRLKHEWLDGEYVAELARKVHKKPYLETSGTLASGGTLTLASDIDVKKNASQTFFAKFSEWADGAALTVGHGFTDFMASYAVIDKDNITTYYYNGTVIKQEAHGLTLSDFVSINIMVKNNESASIHLATATGKYKLSSTNWYGCNGDIYAKSNGLNLTDCRLSWTSADLLSDVWVFGDSYLNISDVTRFPYYIIHEFGYDRWLACGYGGASAESELLAFEQLLALGTPKYAVWTLGMNNMDSGAINSGYQTATEQFIAMCAENSIVPIICTIPSTGTIDNSYKNAWVKASGCRYIDFADAVEKASGVWYDGMLSADGVHPAALGAVTLAHRFIRDFPEIAMCK